MIELRDNEKLYLVLNESWDDTTTGLVIINDDDFSKFKEFIENLNKNSTYGCMPIISVYEIDKGMVREATDADDDLLYLNDRTYVGANGMSTWSLYKEGVKVI